MAQFFTLFGQTPPKDQVIFSQPSAADQTFRDECDIHHIIAGFGTTGLVDSPGAHDPTTLQYGDTTLLPDYQTACNLVANVNADFANLPASVRAEFNNDPYTLLGALTSTDEKIVKRLEDLGLKQRASSAPTDPAPNPEPTT